MAEIGRDDEMDSLMDNPELDVTKIAEQVTGKKKEETPPVTPPAGTPPPITPPAGTPPATPPKKDVTDPETFRSGMLNDMFGDHFKTVDEVKKANIPEALKELNTLRQKVQELDTQVKAKPKHAFANDDLAKMNEFVRETGIKDVTIFNRLNAEDVANMKDMDAVILNHIIENPRLARRSMDELRGYFERKYELDPTKIDPKQVEAGTLTQEELDKNKREYDYRMQDLEIEGEKVKQKLLALKGKIKMPEIPTEESSKEKPKWTPDVETKQKSDWTKVGNTFIEKWAKIPLNIKNKEGVAVPIANFGLPEKAKTDLLNNALAYVVSNQLEVNEANVTAVATAMFHDIRNTFLEDMLQVVFERARSMTEKEYMEAYNNPSKNNPDQPDRKDGVKTEEDIQNEAYALENSR